MQSRRPLSRRYIVAVVGLIVISIGMVGSTLQPATWDRLSVAEVLLRIEFFIFLPLILLHFLADNYLPRYKDYTQLALLGLAGCVGVTWLLTNR